jgi:hypothetical protein
VFKFKDVHIFEIISKLKNVQNIQNIFEHCSNFRKNDPEEIEI